MWLFLCQSEKNYQVHFPLHANIDHHHCDFPLLQMDQINGDKRKGSDRKVGYNAHSNGLRPLRHLHDQSVSLFSIYCDTRNDVEAFVKPQVSPTQ